jgi:signal peptidase
MNSKDRSSDGDGNDADEYLLTKGDNNPVDDRGLYNPGQLWIKQSDIVGKVKGFLPLVGMITIVLNDYPQLKIILLFILALFVVTSKDD